MQISDGGGQNGIVKKRAKQIVVSVPDKDEKGNGGKQCEQGWDAGFAFVWICRNKNS